MPFDPNQPRDDHGMWTDGGGDSASWQQHALRAERIHKDLLSRANMSSEELQAAKYYQGGHQSEQPAYGHVQINAHLKGEAGKIKYLNTRTGELKPASVEQAATIERHAQVLNNAAKQRSLPEKTLLYRGARLSPAQISKLQPGSLIKNVGLISTTLNMREAQIYSRNTPDKSVIFRIHGAKNGVALPSSEHEVLLSHETKLRVDQVRTIKGVKYVDLVVER